jgi:hypothetical protein
MNQSTELLNTSSKVFVSTSLLFFRLSTGRIVSVGNGLFASDDIAVGERIGYFQGERINKQQYDLRYQSGRGGYAIHISKDKYLDCFNNAKVSQTCMMSMANAISPNTLNCDGIPTKFVSNSRLAVSAVYGTVALVATINIKKGDEILYPYGNSYNNSNFMDMSNSKSDLPVETVTQEFESEDESETVDFIQLKTKFQKQRKELRRKVEELRLIDEEMRSKAEEVRRKDEEMRFRAEELISVIRRKDEELRSRDERIKELELRNSSI